MKLLSNKKRSFIALFIEDFCFNNLLLYYDIQTLLGEIQNCNLLICELVTLLALERELQSDSEFLSFVAVYISSLLIPDGSRRKIQISSESMDQMIRSTKKLLDISADQGIYALYTGACVFFTAIFGL